MLKATFFIQRSANTREDDIIRMFEEEHEMVRIVYSSPEFPKKKGREMFVTMSKAVDYISALMKSLQYDTQPFEHFQVTTAIHPSVLYHVSDLDKPEVRHLIEDMTEMALRQSVAPTNV